MKTIILAAGYATRLGPISESTPKPLLPVAGRPLVEHVIAWLETVQDPDSICMVTNHKYMADFEQWRRDCAGRMKAASRIDLIDNGTTRNEERLGAIGDLAFVLSARAIDEDIMVLAADSIFNFSLARLQAFFAEKRAPMITIWHVKDPGELRRTGNAAVDEDFRVTGFVEKPEKPISPYGVPPAYLFPRATLPLIGQYLDEGNNPDAPGHFIAWLHRRVPIYAMLIEKPPHHIGSLESYQDVQERLSN